MTTRLPLPQDASTYKIKYILNCITRRFRTDWLNCFSPSVLYYLRYGNTLPGKLGLYPSLRNFYFTKGRNKKLQHKKYQEAEIIYGFQLKE
ncbi:hypothetical protein NPIL_95141, partial [Nephila pilipes]